MDYAARARRNISTDDLLQIASRVHSCSYGRNSIRSLDAEGDRWIVFADICKALGYKNPNHESKKVDPEEKRKLDIGLKNTLAVCANKRDAADFQKWADKEIFGKGADTQ